MLFLSSGLIIKVRFSMKLRDEYGVSLKTKNFRKVMSESSLSIDYNQNLKIIEIEYLNEDVYHYLKANNKEWAKFYNLIVLNER